MLIDDTNLFAAKSSAESSADLLERIKDLGRLQHLVYEIAQKGIIYKAASPEVRELMVAMLVQIGDEIGERKMELAEQIVEQAKASHARSASPGLA